ncbi:MAG: hypothetical protein IPI67_37070 [Myxococcales bacterium]|nr:hypothetical protein [Myxococcales bacterium]
MPSPDEKDRPAPEKPRSSQFDLGELPDFSGEELPDLSGSAVTGGEVAELSPEDQIVVEISVPESEPKTSKQANAEHGPIPERAAGEAPDAPEDE